MIIRRPCVDVDASARHTQTSALLWPWPWPLDLQNVIGSSVTSTTSTKVRRKSVHWFVRYRANRRHARKHALTDGRPENIMPLTHLSVGGGIDIALCSSDLSTNAIICRQPDRSRCAVRTCRSQYLRIYVLERPNSTTRNFTDFFRLYLLSI